MASQLTLTAQKKVLRSAMASTLQKLSSLAIKEQSEAVAARILSMESFQRSRSISCYLNMPSRELDTLSLVSEIISRDKTLFVPKIMSRDGSMDFLKIYDDEDLITLPAGLWGIKEPHTLSDDVELDMILVPGVAFDESHSRLGHGKGYYDRFLTSYTSSGRRAPLLVALALREQVLSGDEIPIGEHDWKMDFIVTPDRIIDSGNVSNERVH
ncbi:hypothetical protein BD779DRAFT_1708119 [Infundibulicybe gibba]|nr:hypothetical protein BD779DRAFT_1708119 [Infundibulicybe gibba]